MARLFFIGIQLSLVVCAQELTSASLQLSAPQTPELKREIRTKLEYANVTKEIDLLGEIKVVNEKLGHFSEIKKKECEGEFTVIEFNTDGEEERKKSKLSKEERKRCMTDLISFRREVVGELFNLRRKLLIQNHKDHLYQLESLKSESLKELEEMAQKYKITD
jgi:hypothetical protein